MPGNIVSHLLEPVDHMTFPFRGILRFLGKILIPGMNTSTAPNTVLLYLHPSNFKPWLKVHS